ncbi:MAG: DNA polymerase IV [Clostridiaceae bacterium]|nr:DNA polymerase IV [Clostridiaceae bacterium]
MERVILHSDLNNFYASVECLYNPQLRDKPVAVCGSVEERHGIVLAKNYIAKKYGIITGEAVWQAKQKCPRLVVVSPDMDKYIYFSKMAREIYEDYTDMIEPFGLDECWLDVTGSTHLFGDGKKIADEIRERIKREMGITASIGVSYNKIFAKLGSDIKKPDATTVITKENYKDVVWRLPVSDLLYVGSATKYKLKKKFIYTIGDLANTNISDLKLWFGKWGEVLWVFANGLDNSPVANILQPPKVKSIGNSTTAPRDLIEERDIKITLYILSESVAARLRKHHYLARTIKIYVRDSSLNTWDRQEKLEVPTSNSTTISKKAYELFLKNSFLGKPIRSLGVKACDLQVADDVQMSFLAEYIKEDNLNKLELAIDNIRRRFGHFSIQRGIMLEDLRLSDLDPQREHVVHPVSFFR